MPDADRQRPTDLARVHGLSAQAVRNYEADGILPPAPRGPQGYRWYSPLHAGALRAFLALRGGFGHQTAAEILRAANSGDVDLVFRLVDQGHAELLRDRVTLDEVARAVGELSTETPAEPSGGALTVGELAHRLDVHPATLRKWEAAGILRPVRDRSTGYRRYRAAEIRDAQLAHQLRRGGYLLGQIAEVVERVREAGGVVPLDEALRSWRGAVRWRGQAMVDGSAELSGYLRLVAQRDGGPDGEARG